MDRKVATLFELFEQRQNFPLLFVLLHFIHKQANNCSLKRSNEFREKIRLKPNKGTDKFLCKTVREGKIFQLYLL